MVNDFVRVFPILYSERPVSVTQICLTRTFFLETGTHGGGRPVNFKYALSKASDVQMPKVELNIPEHLEMQIAQMVEQGEFLNREEAIEDLLSTGMKAYKTSGPMDDNDSGFEDDGMMGHEDEYVF